MARPDYQGRPKAACKGNGPEDALRGRARQASPSAASSPAAASSPSLDFRAEGATIVAMVKSRSVMLLSAPFGSVTSEMWIDAPTSRPAREITTSSGMFADPQDVG